MSATLLQELIAIDATDPGEVTPAPITEAQWARILRGCRHSFRILVKPEQVEWAGKRAVSCGGCRHTRMYGDPRRGFCLAQKCMVSLAFPKLCRTYVEDDRE